MQRRPTLFMMVLEATLGYEYGWHKDIDRTSPNTTLETGPGRWSSTPISCQQGDCSQPLVCPLHLTLRAKSFVQLVIENELTYDSLHHFQKVPVDWLIDEGLVAVVATPGSSSEPGSGRLCVRAMNAARSLTAGPPVLTDTQLRSGTRGGEMSKAYAALAGCPAISQQTPWT